MPEIDQKTLQWLLKKSSGSPAGKISTGRVLNGFAADLGLDPISIRRELHALRIAGRVEYSSTPEGEPVSSFIKVFKADVVVPAHMVQWQEVIASDSGLTDEDKMVLNDLGEPLNGFPKESMRKLLQGLVQLRNDQSHLDGKMAFSVSAQYLLGSSKLLSSLDKRLLKAFGINVDAFMQRPPYIVIGGQCNAPEAVILVENPVAFETAVGTNAANKYVFVCTFGFGLSGAGNDYGFQLASVVETGNAIILQRTPGTSISLVGLLTHPNVYLWGDLDMVGMQIFERIAAKVPHVQLSALYGPMIDAIGDAERRHPYATATGSGKPGQKLFQSSRQDVQKMLAYCERYAVDQEIVLPEEIELLAGQTLDISALGNVTLPS
ncbi:MAG: DUF2220 family protein [Gallionella sp.]|nr:DUF2220 family protein [Gallionella sp.]